MGFGYRTSVFLFGFVFLCGGRLAADTQVRVGVAGLTHGHVEGFLYEVTHRSGFELVGVFETSREPVDRYFAKYGLRRELLFGDLDALLNQSKPDVIAAFGTTADQVAIVRAAVAKRIPVMLEKPLGASLAQAAEIEKLSRDSGVPVFVNYETSWYPNTHLLFTNKVRSQLGPIKKVIVRTGHQGPREIGVHPEFFAWLTDPAKGGGALLDFGCYGIQLVTELFGNLKPTAVTAITQKLKSDAAYGPVEDEATLVVEYPGALAIIQASWNWSSGRKDWEVHGQQASLASNGRDQVTFTQTNGHTWSEAAPGLAGADADALGYLQAMAGKGGAPSVLTKDLGSPRLNWEVSRLLEAAAQSAKSGRRVTF